VAPTRKVLVGLIGAGIQRSLSPLMHESEARAQGLSLHYQLIDLDRDIDGGTLRVDDLPRLVESARDMGFVGLNITYPCKQAVLPLLDELSDQAAAMGAVNTVVFRAGRSIGLNTDGPGWRWGFERALPAADLSSVVLLGAGGAGSAIADALIRMGVAHLALVDTDRDRAEALAAALRQRSHATRIEAGVRPDDFLDRASGLVHATPTGMAKRPGLPLEARLLRPDLWVSEIVYFPLDTALLQAARAAGCAVSDGGGMAVGQAVGAFEAFTGLVADASRMDRTFRQAVGANLSPSEAG
jgi:shikimate dehydrogenase